jgi:hypothetical protein
LTPEQLSRLREWFRRAERHLLEEVVRSRIVQAEVAALGAAEEAGRFPLLKDKVEAHLAIAARWRDFLTMLEEVSTLDGLTISQPTLPNHA